MSEREREKEREDSERNGTCKDHSAAHSLLSLSLSLSPLSFLSSLSLSLSFLCLRDTEGSSGVGALATV